MKKFSQKNQRIPIYLKTLFCYFLICVSFSLPAQITIKFTVDMTGVDIGPGGVHIAGQFATDSSETITEDWEPAADGSMLTLLYDAVYGVEIVFPETVAGETLLFQFLRDDVWFDGFADMSEANAGDIGIDESCGMPDGFGGYNRLITIATCNAEYNAVWNYCTSLSYISTDEICNNHDDNCDGNIDEGLMIFNYFADTDTDGFGNADDSVATCMESAPVGYTSDGSDCNDTDAAVNPAAEEIENGTDDNCNGEVDEGFTAVEEIGVGTFILYPNPFVSEITIDFKGEVDATFTLFDVTGKIVYTEILHAEKTSQLLNLSTLDSGIYLYAIRMNEEMTSGKILKNK